MNDDSGPITFPQHDCKDIRHTTFVNSKEYTAEYCSICTKFTKFRWKSFVKRIKSIF